MDPLRHCSRCDSTKAESAFYRNLRTGKFNTYCRDCTRSYRTEQYAARPEVRAKALATAAKRVADNPEGYRTYQAAYRGKHRQGLNDLAKEYRVQHRDSISEKDRERNRRPERRKARNERVQERRISDPEFRFRINASSKKANAKRYPLHRASILEKARQRREANPEKVREETRRSVARWVRAHPAEAQAFRTRRRALRRGAKAEGFNDAAHYREMETWQNGRCYHCDGPFGVYHRDHLVAVDRQGRHEAANLALACQTCNITKGKKILWKEWVPPLAYASPLLLSESPLVVSTFAASERGRPDARSVLPGLRASHPGQPIFFDWEWVHRRAAVLNMLAAREGSVRPVFARKTTVVEITTEEARAFLETHHVQGFGRGTVYLGLVAGEELLATSSWLEIKGAVELNRLAFKGRVQGGFGKLLAAFQRVYLPQGMPILSFVDPRYADGHSYSNFGFEDAGYTESPVYYYVGPAGIYHRRLFTKDALRRRFVIFDEQKSEMENARMNGYYRLFGLKQRRFLLR